MQNCSDPVDYVGGGHTHTADGRCVTHTGHSVLVSQLRRLQYAANMLNFHEFCDATGWPRDEYSKHKFVEFQALGRMHVFDDRVLEVAVKFYEDRVAAQREAVS